MNVVEPKFLRGLLTRIFSTNAITAESPVQPLPSEIGSFMELTIPGPPVSVNHLYFVAPHGKRVITKTGRAWKEAAGWQAKKAMIDACFPKQESGALCVMITFYFKTVRGDIDNCVKATLDCMTGIVYEDDDQINELHVYKHKDASEPRTEIVVATQKEERCPKT